MDAIRKLGQKLRQPRFLIVIVLIALFVASAIYAYNKIIKPSAPKYIANREFTGQPAGDDKKATLYYFTATWCPISKRVKPEWDKLASEYEDKKMKGYDIEFIVVDCEKEVELADKFGIDSYPTIVLVVGNQVIEYDANVKYDTLIQFLNSSLPN